VTRWNRISTIFLAAVCLLFAFLPLAKAQQGQPSATEVYLTFQYRGIVGKYVTTYYKNQQFYLPVSELFTILKINHEVDQGSLTISGNYLGKKEYVIDFNNQVARSGETELQLQADDFLIKEIDYFVTADVFEKLFNLSFSTSFNNLTLDLDTDDKMPVMAQYEREQKRKKLDREEPIYQRSYYPLQYDRNYNSLDGAFLDYNFSAVYSDNSQLFTFNNALGAEFLAGDVQGNIFGAFSQQQSSFTTSGLRWRYVQRNGHLLNSATVGQTNSEGITSRSITGMKISNKPVEPRLLFDRYPIEGTAPAQSEVELYLNNRLVDFQEADQSGNYRFLVPLTYGSTNYSVRIYTPEGQAIERNARIQIPFDYLPPGEVDYSISGGRLENPILGSNERGYMGEATVATGITNWLTAEASTEYLTSYHGSLPSFTGTLNARLFSNYLISANVNSENFYRLTSSVVYSSGASWNLSYDYNPGESRIYNLGGSDHQARVNLFTPFQLGEIPLNIRWSSTYQQRGNAKLLRYRTDLSTRLGRLNVRLGYQDQQAGALNFETTASSQLTNSYTYSVGRSQQIPGILRGMFLRGQLSYLTGLDEFEEIEFQLSRDLMDTGRLQFSFGHNFLGDFSSLSLNLTVDLNKIRSNTTSRSTGSNFSLTQNFRGSIGYDPHGEQFLLNNRQQVGQAGAAVRLFVDNNNDGSYQDSTDNIINDPAVRLNRSGGKTSVRKGINYISQLLPYYRYNIEINKSVLSNPLLVPNVENFSIITDPNQYKTIEIPFYLSGVISGKVERLQDSTRTGLSGVRLYLESQYEENTKRTPFKKELRTFSDGSFYTYEVPPGKYNLFIDPSQLEFLGGISKPDTMQIEVQALAEGDFIEDLNFMVVSKNVTESTDSDSTKKVTASKVKSPENPTSSTNKKTSEVKSTSNYKVQIASFKSPKRALRLATEAAEKFGVNFNIIKNTRTNLFAVRAKLYGNRKQAIEKIKAYHDSSYTDAALVVFSGTPVNTTPDSAKFIQLGAFSNNEHATAFKKESEQLLAQKTALTYDHKRELYKIYLNEPFSNPNERLEQLKSLKSTYPSFKEAFITTINDSGEDQNKLPKRSMEFVFNIQIDGITRNEETNVLSVFEEQRIESEITYTEKNTLLINNVPTWTKVQSYLTKLSNILEVGYPIVILIEKS